MEEDDLGPSWRHLEAVGVLPGCHPPGQHGGRDPESGVRNWLLTTSRDDWLSPEELGLLIESPQNSGGLSQPQLDPQVPQVFRIGVHGWDESRERDDPDGQQAQHPSMDWALGA